MRPRTAASGASGSSRLIRAASCAGRGRRRHAGAPMGGTDEGALTGTTRLDYWRTHDPGDERLFESLRLGPVPEAALRRARPHSAGGNPADEPHVVLRQVEHVPASCASNGRARRSRPVCRDARRRARRRRRSRTGARTSGRAAAGPSRRIASRKRVAVPWYSARAARRARVPDPRRSVPARRGCAPSSLSAALLVVSSRRPGDRGGVQHGRKRERWRSVRPSLAQPSRSRCRPIRLGSWRSTKLQEAGSRPRPVSHRSAPGLRARSGCAYGGTARATTATRRAYGRQQRHAPACNAAARAACVRARASRPSTATVVPSIDG